MIYNVNVFWESSGEEKNGKEIKSLPFIWMLKLGTEKKGKEEKK